MLETGFCHFHEQPPVCTPERMNFAGAFRFQHLGHDFLSVFCQVLRNKRVVLVVFKFPLVGKHFVFQLPITETADDLIAVKPICTTDAVRPADVVGGYRYTELFHTQIGYRIVGVG